jgi:hypothetical protein
MPPPLSAALVSVSASTIGIGADVDADLRGQGLHGRFRTDERGLDQAGGGGFNSALEGYVTERPHHGRGNRRQILAALDELVEDVVVGGWPTKGSTATASARGARSLI